MGKSQFSKPHAAQRAAHCLGTSVEELTKSVFSGNASSATLNRRASRAHLEQQAGGENVVPEGMESLEGFVVGLYQEVFNALVFLINRLHFYYIKEFILFN